jgi:hypothetical protein
VISIEITGLKDLHSMLVNYNRIKHELMREFISRLGDIGIETAGIKFQTAHYDGVNDVVVEPKWVNENTLAVLATGQSVTFIEFGTGITYADDHPLAQQMGMIRGEYGQGKGKQDTWVYYGEPGTMGEWLRTTSGGEYAIRTHGNPANRCMYDASKDMRNNIIKIAKEVFRID